MAIADFSRPPKSVGGLVPKAGSGRKGGSAEAAHPGLVGDELISRREVAVTIGARKLTTSSEGAGEAVGAVALAKLAGVGSPVQ